MSEVRWTKCGDIPIFGNNFWEFGVGFIVSKGVKDCVVGYVPQSSRVMLLQLNTRPIRTNLIQVYYAPTSDSSEAECEKFYKDIETVLKLVKKHEFILVIGDFNAKVGDTLVHNIVGPFGFRARNDKGDRFIEFCAEYSLTIMNT